VGVTYLSRKSIIMPILLCIILTGFVPSLVNAGFGDKSVDRFMSKYIKKVENNQIPVQDLLYRLQKSVDPWVSRDIGIDPAPLELAVYQYLSARMIDSDRIFSRDSLFNISACYVAHYVVPQIVDLRLYTSAALAEVLPSTFLETCVLSCTISAGVRLFRTARALRAELTQLRPDHVEEDMQRIDAIIPSWTDQFRTQFSAMMPVSIDSVRNVGAILKSKILRCRTRRPLKEDILPL
jgi:hypothetical protein